MSRSIHHTRRDLAKERRWRHPHDELRKERYREILGALLKKRALKRKSAALREQQELPVLAPPRSPETIPIRVTDAGPYAHHHASPDDVRAILRALPEGTLTGIEAIDLGLGKEACAEFVRRRDEEDQVEPDPFTGRIGTEIVPGLYSGPLLGQYRDGRIWIFALVHEPLDGRQRPPGLELYMRLRQLATLVHEVAHHDDSMLRTGRASDVMTKSRFEKGEEFATEKEREWVREIVVPYLERAHPDQVRAWERWMEATVGIPFPLRTLADDLHCGGIPWSESYLDFLGNVVSGRDPLEARLEFADDLHYNWLFELSLAVTRSVLAQHPENLDARALEADVLEHLDRLDEAQASVSKVLERDESHSRAWKVQILIHTKRGAWRELAEAAPRARQKGRKEDARRFLGDEALAHAHLGNEAAFATCVALLRATGRGYDLGKAALLEVLMKLRLGRFEEVLSLADAAGPELPRIWRERVAACGTLALLRLGRGPGATNLREGIVELRADGFPEWADELARVSRGRRLST